MTIDLRIPVGLLFVSLGLIMGIFGLTSNPAIYDKSLGINVNLDWGIVELIFGALMIAFGRARHPADDAPVSPPKAVTTRHDVPPPRVKPPVAHG
jgi:hypothetical protein